MLRATPIETSEPVWEIADLFPHQGAWTEDDYLELETNHLIEYAHGQVEVLPMPTISHQRIVAFLYNQLLAFITQFKPGTEVLFAPLKVRLWPGKYREPDLVVMFAEHRERLHEQYLDLPDLVVEIVSPDNRQLDVSVKRREYAQAGIPEYWIVDPEGARILVLTLVGNHYEAHGEFKTGDQATSLLLADFEVNVEAVWAAARQ
jgi:Uma2 family endonuclease